MKFEHVNVCVQIGKYVDMFVCMNECLCKSECMSLFVCKHTNVGICVFECVSS